MAQSQFVFISYMPIYDLRLLTISLNCLPFVSGMYLIVNASAPMRITANGRKE